jgi:hypothetical protein
MTSTALVRDDAKSSKVGESSLASVSNVARASLALRRWEMENLPCNGSHLGFEIFMILILEVASTNHHGVMLKNLYLSLPFSEKGLRLHIRRLESNGWINIKKSDQDFRSSRVELTPRSWGLLDRYFDLIQCFIDSASPALTLLRSGSNDSKDKRVTSNGG